MQRIHKEWIIVMNVMCFFFFLFPWYCNYQTSLLWGFKGGICRCHIQKKIFFWVVFWGWGIGEWKGKKAGFNIFYTPQKGVQEYRPLLTQHCRLKLGTNVHTVMCWFYLENKCGVDFCFLSCVIYSVCLELAKYEESVLGFILIYYML